MIYRLENILRRSLRVRDKVYFGLQPKFEAYLGYRLRYRMAASLRRNTSAEAQVASQAPVHAAL